MFLLKEAHLGLSEQRPVAEYLGRATKFLTTFGDAAFAIDLRIDDGEQWQVTWACILEHAQSPPAKILAAKPEMNWTRVGTSLTVKYQRMNCVFLKQECAKAAGQDANLYSSRPDMIVALAEKELSDLKER